MIRFYYDVVCPYAYIASTRVQALAHEAGVGIEWVPVLLGGILRSVGSPDRPGDLMNPNKARLNVLDTLRQADLAGVSLVWPDTHPMRTVTAMRLLHAVDGAQRVALTRALYRAYWCQGLDVTQVDVLQEIAAPFNLDVASVNADPTIRQALFDATDRAVSIGAFGVPTFEVDGRIFWGADRMPLVRAALGLPRPARTEDGRAGARLTFFHDFSSPYSYLASTQVEQIAREQGAELERVPFLLGALFKELGTPGVPLHSFAEARQRYSMQDLLDHARWWDVDFRFASTFPLRTVTALRVAIAEPRTTDAIYRAAWVEDRDIGQPEVLHRVLDEAGFDGAALLERTRDPAIKQQLFTNTARAERQGACGAPTMVVDDQHVFWGQDRLEMVHRALGDWRPPPHPA